MNNAALYILTVFIWGSTWIAIKYQLGVVSPLVSIGHRFALAALLIFTFLWLRGGLRRLALKDHLFIALQGLCLFCINYVFIYAGTETLTSGLVAVVFSTMVILNLVGSAVFLGTRASPMVAVGGLVGLVGMVGVFLPEFETLSLTDKSVQALLLVFLGTCSASVGNLLAVRNQRSQVPLLLGNGWGMLYGSLVLYLAALLLGQEIQFDPRAPYMLSLLYLSLFGSVVAFWAYLSLVGNIGADRAAYSSLLFPIVALLISTLFESYAWTLVSFAGFALVLFGNWLVMRRGAA